MPVGYQIIPEHRYPHVMTQINDNTIVTSNYSPSSSDQTALLCVFTSPKGRDNKVITLEEGVASFMEEYGLGPHSQYGQPLMNAYAAAMTGACTLHCMRVMPNDASYSNTTLIAKYKVDTDDAGEPVLKIMFYTKSSDSELTDLNNIDLCCTVPNEVDEEGFTSVKLFTIASKGRGIYGKNFRFRITTDRSNDKLNDFKNYFLGIYSTENGLEQKENFGVVWAAEALYSGLSYAADDVVNDSQSGSTRIQLYTNTDGFEALFEAYKAACPDTTLNQTEFDPFFGLDKWTRDPLPNLQIIGTADASPAGANETAVAVSSTDGIPLTGGSDGSLSTTIDSRTRQDTLDNLYYRAFSCSIDPLIKSKNRYPTTFIMDADFDVQTKLAIAALANERTDCVAILDCGLGITTKASVRNYVETNLQTIVRDRIETVEAYCMKVRDPYSQKTVTVTSTYWLCGRYPKHIQEWSGKHRPLAGNTFGIMDGYIRDSVYPIFDEDIDSDEMDKLADIHVNFARFNCNQIIIRATQDTRQQKLSNLSELSNVLILLDIKRDCERLCATYEYDFSEADDIARFNVDIEVITARYADAQVRSISGHFDKNDWEAEHSILHLYVELVHKDLIRTTIIEIDVNRSSQS
ncbi:MAG: hypothetical protein NC548_05805 [Lachnospiraceae bacterium]|nr:hypothetical protein [Lachnospiraceae bacterium]